MAHGAGEDDHGDVYDDHSVANSLESSVLILEELADNSRSMVPKAPLPSLECNEVQ